MVPISGRSVFLALDVSASMRAASWGSKLAITVVRRTAQAFIRLRAGDKVGLILFGSRPYQQAPLSSDLQTVSAMADEANIGLAGEGTSLGDAIGLSITRLRSKDVRHRVLVLLTDGTNTGGTMTPDEAVRLAQHYRLRIYTIGVGAPQGTASGEGLDKATLTHISRATGDGRRAVSILEPRMKLSSRKSIRCWIR